MPRAIPISLDEAGYAQAQAMAPFVAALRPNRIWSRTSRASQTAVYVAALTGVTAEVDARLRSISVGSARVDARRVPGSGSRGRMPRGWLRTRPVWSRGRVHRRRAGPDGACAAVVLGGVVAW
ncbi:MAG: histidine phosphatase family protein [Austwickia sp.]|nr:histidine phosphatase family protein [Austwickia sp.]